MSSNNDSDDYVGCISFFFIVLIVCIFTIEWGRVKEFFYPCTYSVDKVVDIKVPTEAVTIIRGGFKLKKRHCEEVLIEIQDMPNIPNDFTGTVKVEITHLTSPTNYTGKVIHIIPHKVKPNLIEQWTEQ